MSSVRRPILLLLLLALLLPLTSPTLGQRKRAGARAVVLRHRQAAGSQAPPAFTYGDVTLSGFQTISGQLGVVAEARGPNTTVDLVDPQTKAKGRLQARLITVTWTKGSGQAQRVDAVGDVRYSGVRPTPDGEQSARGTGTRGSYVRAESLLTLQGPVEFHAEQPSPDGKGRQSVTGTSESATYNSDKQVLTFAGHVDASVTIPESLETPAKVSGAESVRLELAERPYKFNVSGGTVNFEPRQAPKRPK